MRAIYTLFLIVVAAVGTGHHYMGSAECFAEMSDALAKAMIEMIKIGKHE